MRVPNFREYVQGLPVGHMFMIASYEFEYHKVASDMLVAISIPPRTSIETYICIEGCSTNTPYTIIELEEAEQSLACTCDLYSVLLRSGCQCGGT